jgi:hypothetical protein
MMIRINGIATRLRAPPQLAPDERRIFSEIVTSTRPGHFESSDLGLLVEFSRLTAYVGRLWNRLHNAAPDERADSEAALSRAQKALFSVCRLLRLSPSGRTPNPPSRESARRSAAQEHRPGGSVYDRLAIEEAADHDPDQ